MSQEVIEHAVFLSTILIPTLAICLWFAWPSKQKRDKGGVAPGSSLWENEEDSGVMRRERYRKDENE